MTDTQSIRVTRISIQQFLDILNEAMKKDAEAKTQAKEQLIGRSH